MKPPVVKGIHPKFLRKYLTAKAEVRAHEIQLAAWHCGHLLRDDPDELRDTINPAVCSTIEAYQLGLKRLASYKEFHSVRMPVVRTPTTVRIGKAVVRYGQWKDKAISRWARWLATSTTITRLKGNEWNHSTQRIAEQVLAYWEEQHQPKRRKRYHVRH